MGFSCQEQSEVFMRLHRQNFFFQNAHKTNNQMQVFQAEPFTLPRSFSQELQRILILISTH